MIPKKLAQFVASMAETTVYTVPAATYTLLKEVVVANTSSSSQTIAMSLVPVGNTASSLNRLLPTVPLGPNAVAVFNFSTVMATGDFLSVRASASSAITVTISGLEDPGAGTSSGTGNFASTGMVVTSTTRPANPYDGQTIYESDTDKMLTWNGYMWASPLPVPAQTLAYAQLTGNQNGIGTTATDITGLAVTFTVPAGRRIRVSAYALMQKRTASGFTRMYLMEGATFLSETILTVGTDEYQTHNPSVVLTPSAGTHTYKVQVDTQNNTVDLLGNPGYPAYLLVEDITGDPPPVVVNSVPVGVLAQATRTSNFGTTSGTFVDVPGFSLNVTVPAGRLLRIALDAYVFSTVAGDSMTTRIFRDGVLLKGHGDPDLEPNWGDGIHMETFDSPSAGAHVYNVQINRGAGSGTVNLASDASNIAHFIVEDVTPTPAPANSAPSSTLAYNEVLTSSAAITTETDLAGLTATVTVAAGRRIKITADGELDRTVVDGESRISIKEGTTLLQIIDVAPNVAAGDVHFHGSVVLSPTAGTHTYKLALSLLSGTGTTKLVAGTGFPSSILVEDITATSVYPVPISNGVAVVSSTNRPSSPTDGLTIYETDTDRMMVYDGTAWEPMSIPIATSGSRPSSAEGQVLYETDTDLLKYYNGSAWVTQTNFRMLAAGSALVGSPPAVDTGSIPFKIQCGTLVAVTNSGGGTGGISYPTPFPNGVLYVSAIGGDAGASDNMICTIYQAGLSTFEIIVLKSDGTRFINSTLRFNWIAIGW